MAMVPPVSARSAWRAAPGTAARWYAANWRRTVPATVGAIGGAYLGSQIDGFPVAIAGAAGLGAAGAYAREIGRSVGRGASSIVRGIQGSVRDARDADYMRRVPYDTVILSVDADARNLNVDIDGGKYATPTAVNVLPDRLHGVGAPPIYGVGATRRSFSYWTLDNGVANARDINSLDTAIQVRIRPRTSAKVTAHYV